MTFFFQTNPIRVILNIILALLSIRVAYNHKYGVYNILNMDNFLTQTHGFATGGLHSPAHFWTAEKTPAYSHSKAWRSKDHFYITPIGFF